MTQDADERQAEALERFLADRETSREAAAPSRSLADELGFAAALAALAEMIELDPAFAADLDAQLQARAAQVLPTAERPAGGVRRNGRVPRRLRGLMRIWPPLAAMLFLALLLTVLAPPIRAGVQEALRIGAVRVGLIQPTAPSHASPTPTPLPSVLDLAGETTLARARAAAGFPVRLPAYPPDLGPPDRVYLQHLDGPMVVLVWLDHAHPAQVRLSLHELASGAFVYKFPPQTITETSVHGQRALWAEGPYLIEVQQGDQVRTETRRLITGHVLIWTEGSVTYRLETALSLTEAVRIAESLR